MVFHLDIRYRLTPMDTQDRVAVITKFVLPLAIGIGGVRMHYGRV